MSTRSPALLPALWFGLAVAACASDPAPPPTNPAGPGAPQAGAVAPPPVQPGPPTAVAPGAPPTQVQGDPIATRDLNFLRQRAQGILSELVGALPPAQQQRVYGIPLVIDDTPGDVNAFAACSSTGRSAMAITDGLLLISAGLSEAQAHDELFQTRKVDEYIHLVATQLEPNRPIPVPPPGFFPASGDSRIVTRQHQVFDEVTAFVLGHELGHHHLGHLPCTASPDPLGAGDVARVLSSNVPLFNQPNELASDLAGTQNVLVAGRNRAAQGFYGWTENGGLLTMRFFAGFGQLSPGDILTSFERSHPPPQLRVPIIQQAAANFRATGGVTPFPIPGFGF